MARLVPCLSINVIDVAAWTSAQALQRINRIKASETFCSHVYVQCIILSHDTCRCSFFRNLRSLASQDLQN
ncbi:hypothetical protein BDV97DRAFT_349403 [Delphinella strobiligena]|nr:hypothetical protein BDV97DRAFT_349403 [Delphinella strobiligena]